jgi:hypothetical protein
MKYPPGFRYLFIDLAMSIITFAIILAILYHALQASHHSIFCKSCNSIPSPFILQFSFVIFIATSSMSTAVISLAPSFDAIIDSIPVPHPISRAVSPLFHTFESARHTFLLSRVYRSESHTRVQLNNNFIFSFFVVFPRWLYYNTFGNMQRFIVLFPRSRPVFIIYF